MSLDSLIAAGSIILLVVVSGATAVSGIYVRWVNRQRREPSRYLDMLIARDTRVALGSGTIALLSIYSFLVFIDPASYLPLPRPMGAVIATAVIVAMQTGVVQDAFQFWKDRRIGPDEPTVG